MMIIVSNYHFIIQKEKDQQIDYLRQMIRQSEDALIIIE
jgi:hypothetical protein